MESINQQPALIWRYVKTFENYWDGDEEDLYECACGEKDRRYIPR